MAPKVRDVRTVATLAHERVKAIEQKFSRYREDSVTTQINRSAGGAPVAVDAETELLLDYADTCYQQSNGLFDLTSGVLRRAWNFRDGTVPPPQKIAELLPLIGWKLLERTAGQVRLPLPGMEIDFGGIGKEYAVDCVAALLEGEGISSAMVNFGGDLRIVGPKADGSPWKVGITHPREQGATVASLAMRRGSLASSGDYERYFERDGRRYCHILNPKTGWPVADLQSVSVLAESCLVAGSFSSIAMLLGEMAGAKFLNDTGVPYIMVNRQGEMKIGNEPAFQSSDRMLMGG